MFRNPIGTVISVIVGAVVMAGAFLGLGGDPPPILTGDPTPTFEAPQTGANVTDEAFIFCLEAQTIQADYRTGGDVQGVLYTATNGLDTLEWRDAENNSIGRYVLNGSLTGAVIVALSPEATACMRAGK